MTNTHNISRLDPHGWVTLEQFPSFKAADAKLEYYWKRYPHAIVDVLSSQHTSKHQ